MREHSLKKFQGEFSFIFFAAVWMQTVFRFCTEVYRNIKELT